ncbi:putative harbinger transposase-derived nuclease domain-containing protein [Rosa chinensis]|uniref:Putative harbinger transposase-derived nuclease domain-containing protein n=1 Tax=Rosa chinensis TaxID=74649 RepID=A0A2P6PWC6_ROSCH|nr:putative harbinger transposase-derived nuclease domain-containing protein [Rosa chinensis]
MKPSENEFNGVAPEIMRDNRYMPHFKDCIGAIDGVHIPTSIAPEKQIPYIGRKGIRTQNVMAACNFDMQFIYVCAGWEESAHDTRVFLSVLRDPVMNFPKPPPGKYYVVDSGYPQMNGFLGPYKGPRQHFQQYRRQEPRNEKEIFNQAHSSLRSVIECTFGVWKKKWKILRDMQGYSFDKQVKIVIATMTLHNYIRRHAHGDRHFVRSEEREGYGSSGEIEMDDDVEEEYHGHGAQEMETIRNSITQSLMNARNNVNI